MGRKATATGATVELETQPLQLSDDLSVAESCKPTHVQSAITML